MISKKSTEKKNKEAAKQKVQQLAEKCRKEVEEKDWVEKERTMKLQAGQGENDSK